MIIEKFSFHPANNHRECQKPLHYPPVNALTLMVASHQKDVLRVLHFESKQQADCLKRSFTSVIYNYYIRLVLLLSSSDKSIVFRVQCYNTTALFE